MARQTALIRPMFFVDTDVFQRLSQWEKAMMDFYKAHGVQMERISLMGAGEGEPIYTLRDLDVFDQPVSEKTESKPIETKLLEQRKMEEKKPALKKQEISIGNIREKEKEKRIFHKGSYLPRKVGEVPVIRYKPLKKKI